MSNVTHVNILILDLIHQFSRTVSLVLKQIYVTVRHREPGGYVGGKFLVALVVSHFLYFLEILVLSLVVIDLRNETDEQFFAKLYTT